MNRASPQGPGRQRQQAGRNSSGSGGRGSRRSAPPPGQQQQLAPKPLQDRRDAAEQQQEWLAKALASAGVASRRACIALVKSGKVAVNGTVVLDPATKVDVSSDVLAVDGRRLAPAAVVATRRHHYFALHKPAGYICSNVSTSPGMRAVDLLQPWLDRWQLKHKGELPPRLFTVGRLDVATSGLLFLTNDGDWANQVIHPSAGITKEYWVTLAAPPSEQQLQQLRAGVVIDGATVVPKRVQLRGATADAADDNEGSGSSSRAGSSSSKGGERCVLQLDVSEGKKHEVRLLVASAGLEVVRLKRVRVGGFVLPRSLPLGKFMELAPRDLVQVLQPPRGSEPRPPPPPPQQQQQRSAGRGGGSGSGSGSSRYGSSSSSSRPRARQR